MSDRFSRAARRKRLAVILVFWLLVIGMIPAGVQSAAGITVRGIVEDNEPELGFLTLYNEDGSGTGADKTAKLRTFQYVDPDTTPVQRNGKQAAAGDVQPGDTVYLGLDQDGDIASVSAADNYLVRYGIVLSKMPASIAVRFEDGTQQILAIGKGLIVIRDRQIVSVNEIRDGDRVRLLLNESGKSVDLRAVTIGGKEHLISSIYRGTVTKLDESAGKVTLKNLQVFNKGKWEMADRKGFTTIPMGEGFAVYANGAATDAAAAGRLLNYSMAYLAVEKPYGSEEKAVMLSYRDVNDTVVPAASDSLTGVDAGTRSFRLSGSGQKVFYTTATIVVKDDRLVTGNSLSREDAVSLSLDRDGSTGNTVAAVVRVEEPKNPDLLTIYRGRISAIRDNADFTLESFSTLKGTDWAFSKTPKTFRLTYSTRILSDEGILSVRDFKGYGKDSALGKSVYVAADGTDAVLVSTAPYGTGSLRGTVYEADEKSLKLKDVRRYNQTTYLWEGGAEATVGLRKNTVVLRDGKVIDAASIRKGESILALMKDASTEGEGYVILVE